LVLNLINRGAAETLSPRRVIVEELLPVDDVTVRVRLDAAPHSVVAVPADPAVTWQYADGVLEIRVPRVDIHTAIVVR
jgi:hypothetical protein